MNVIILSYHVCAYLCFKLLCSIMTRFVHSYFIGDIFNAIVTGTRRISFADDCDNEDYEYARSPGCLDVRVYLFW